MKRKLAFFYFFLIVINTVYSQQKIPFSVNGNQFISNAKWIAPPGVALQSYGVYHFRKVFTRQSRSDSFLVHISADNRYRLYINGSSIICGPQRSDVAHWHYETINLAPYLNTGENVIALVVWNQGEYSAWAQTSLQTGLWIEGSGEASVLNTNSSWKVIEDFSYAPDATVAHITGPFEQVLAQRYPWGWEQLNYKDDHWKNAVETEIFATDDAIAKTTRQLFPRNIPLPEEQLQRFKNIRRVEGISMNDSFIKGNGVLKINPWITAAILIDQGELTTAYPELKVSGGKGCKITVTYAEALYSKSNDEKGNRNDIDNKYIRGDKDVFILDGGEQRVFRPLWYRTFRYVELKIENHQLPLAIDDYHSIFTAYPFKENAAFTSNDKSLTDLWNTAWRTSRLCAFETYMDCPYYEQLQYVGDTRIQALISLYVSGDGRLMKNALEQFYQSQIDEGLTQSRYPSSNKQIIPPFSLFWIDMVHDYWMLRKDDEFIKTFLPAIKKVLSWHEQYISEKKMLGKMPFWNFVDWPKEWPWKGNEILSGVPRGALEGNSSILTLQYVYALKNAAELFTAFNLNDDAKHCNILSGELNAATYKACWDKEKRMLADAPDKTEFSQHANVMGVLAGAIPEKDTKVLLQKIEKDTGIIQCTIYYRFYMNQAFKKAGLGNEYIRMLDPWRKMIAMGLTTFAERPEPTRSDCHAWSASPDYDLLATVAGIVPMEPGFAKVRIEPHMGSLEWIEANMPHPLGMIKLHIKKNRQGINATVNLPQGLKGEFIWNNKKLPLTDGEQKISIDELKQ